MVVLIVIFRFMLWCLFEAGVIGPHDGAKLRIVELFAGVVIVQWAFRMFF